MHEQQRVAAAALVQVGERHAVGDACTLDRERVQAVGGQATSATTYVGGVYEEVENLSSGAVQRKHYVMAAGTRVAVITTDAAQARTTRYLHQDHLGSVAAVTDEQGLAVARYFYDVFGRPVDESGQPLGAGQRDDTSSRGFTDHEQLDALGLIHMNARVLDPALGLFSSVDPILGERDPQSVSPYAYVSNSPLRLVDPTGAYGIAIGVAFNISISGSGGGSGRGGEEDEGDNSWQDDCNLICRMNLLPKGSIGSNSGKFMERVSRAGRFWVLRTARAIVDATFDYVWSGRAQSVAKGDRLGGSAMYGVMGSANAVAPLFGSAGYAEGAGRVLGAASGFKGQREFHFTSSYAEDFSILANTAEGLDLGVDFTGFIFVGSPSDFKTAWTVDISAGIFEIQLFHAEGSSLGLGLRGVGLGVGVGLGYSATDGRGVATDFEIHDVSNPLAGGL